MDLSGADLDNVTRTILGEAGGNGRKTTSEPGRGSVGKSSSGDRYSYFPRRKSLSFLLDFKGSGLFCWWNFLPRLAPVIYICNAGYMDNMDAIAALAALAQPTRLDTFRLLVKKEPKGVPAGELARLMAVPQNTMSAHLAILARAGLVIGERQSRSIIYRADLLRVREVALFLLKDCCGGRPDICAPLVADLTPCRSRKVRVHD
jgi:ArsR family transcriptional regulator, arsenate/arsenite/antimonite-responsive transcriptional repressor